MPFGFHSQSDGITAAADDCGPLKLQIQMAKIRSKNTVKN